IFRYDVVQDRMVVVAGYGEAGAAMVASGHSLPMGTGVVGTAAATGKSVLVPDVRQNPDWQPNPNLPETRGELAVPVVLREELLGVLDVQSDVAGALTDDDRILLESISGPIAVAMEASRLLEEAQTFRQFVEASGQGFGMADLEGQIVYANPALCGMLGENRAEDVYGKPIAAYYAPKLQLRLQEEVIPAVMQAGQWTGELAITSTSGAVIPTLENYFLIRDQVGNPRYIADVLTNISEQRRTAAEMAERLNELNALQRLVTSQGWQSFRATQRGKTPGYRFDRVEMQPLSSGAGVADDETTVSVPVAVGEEIVGRVGVRVSPDKPLSPQERAVLDAVSTQVAEAMERARLLEETQSRAAQESVIGEIAARMQQATDMESLMQITAEELNRVLAASRVYVRLGTPQSLAGQIEN
ncbi:MAG: GAF domain-containing protein, partial [Anaerolineae bacterium]|nr:GAF domain-containing protein [Anaerolineae bacterium]